MSIWPPWPGPAEPPPDAAGAGCPPCPAVSTASSSITSAMPSFSLEDRHARLGRVARRHLTAGRDELARAVEPRPRTGPRHRRRKQPRRVEGGARQSRFRGPEAPEGALARAYARAHPAARNRGNTAPAAGADEGGVGLGGPHSVEPAAAGRAGHRHPVA